MTNNKKSSSFLMQSVVVRLNQWLTFLTVGNDNATDNCRSFPHRFTPTGTFRTIILDLHSQCQTDFSFDGIPNLKLT